MTKRANYIKILIFALCLVLVTASSVSVTFAKYTSTATGSNVARVAAWDIKAGSSASNALNIAGNMPPFKLFETVYDTVQPDSEPVTDEDVKDERIAPGTKGAFELYVRNDSEVTAEYTIQFAIDNPGNVPIIFSFDESLPTNQWYTSIEELNESVADSGTKRLINAPLEMGRDDTITIYWQWLYEQADVESGDLADTQNGVNATKITLTATLTATQVN